MDHLPLENLGNDIRVEQVTSTPRDALNRELATFGRLPGCADRLLFQRSSPGSYELYFLMS
jgi:hypothetical protein